MDALVMMDPLLLRAIQDQVATLRHELLWLDENTEAKPGEARAVEESWGNVARMLERLMILTRRA